MLPVAYLFTREELFSVTGGIAAAIAVGAFAGQVLAVLLGASEEGRRRRTAAGGLFGLVVMIGLLQLTANPG